MCVFVFLKRVNISVARERVCVCGALQLGVNH